jgi:hypothetical protein
VPNIFVQNISKFNFGKEKFDPPKFGHSMKIKNARKSANT